MVESRVLKITQGDNEPEFVLLQALPSGKKALDLRLTGTEGEAPYVVQIKHDNIAALKVNNCPLSDAEWESTLLSFFNQEPLEAINATATVQSEVSITITIRKQVQGITQRLGTITLSHRAEEAIELLAWCAAAADAVVASKQAAASARAEASELEVSVQQLKGQLEELLKAKDDDETALLQKFRDLLNEKKLKIRQQQRILASGSFTPLQVKVPREASPEPEVKKPSKTRGKGRKTAASRAGKRKAAASANEESEDEMVGEAGLAEERRIKLEPEETDDGGDDDDDDRHTLEATVSASDDDADSDEKMTDGAGGGAADVPSAVSAAPPGQATRTEKVGQPPPKRNLPFVNSKAPEASKPSARACDAETDSDDEL